MRRVLVTRPEPGASATAVRLRAMGFEAVIMPLSRIVALPEPEDVPDCEAVAVTSVNALRHASRELIAQLSEKPCFAVGARTAAAARAAGFVTVFEAGGDAEALADAIIGTRKQRRIAYLAGRLRLPDFETMLEKAGVSVAAIEVYDTVAIEPSRREIEALRAGRPIDAALVYSAKAADAVRKLAERHEMAETFSKTVHCCLSERIAARLGEHEPSLMRVADRAEEEALLSLLEK